MPTHTIAVPDEQKLRASLLNNMGLAVSRDGARRSGVAMLRRAMALDPFDLAPRVNLASALIGVGEDDEAEALVTGALAGSDKCVAAWQMLGVLKTHRGDMAAAISCFARALALNPNGPQQKFDMAAAYLRAGDFARGLPLYECRAEVLPATGPLPPGAPWKGEKVGHLAVWGDQGHGDRIMFARFLPWVRDRADKVTFLTNPEVVPLLYGYKERGVVDEINSVYAPGTVFDAQICLSSIPLIYGLTLDNIPPDPGLLAPAAATNSLVAPGLKIGLAWKGNKDHPNDSIRSMPFEELMVLAGDPRNDLFSLQCGPASADVASARAARVVGDMSGMIEGEWAHTAAVIKSLDLVVTVDTAIAHLAGALGIRTFLLLPQFNDWRWLSGRDDSPWYPSLRIFRQTKPLDWRGVMARVAAAVTKLHQDRALMKMLNRELVTIRDAHAPGTADEKEPDVAAVLRKVLRPGDCFVDVGANVGIHTVLAAELVGEKGTVLALEPGPNALPQLRQAIAGRTNVILVEDPAWANACEGITFHLCAEGSGGNALWDPGEFPTNERSRAAPQSVDLITTTLDHEIYGKGLRPRLIKIDTEGAEQRVLEGAIGMLFEQHPPFIVAELHEFGLAKLGCSQQSLRAFMRDAGYTTFCLFADGSRPHPVPDDKLIRSDYILNLLFSTQADVDAVWPGADDANQPRPMFGYLAGEAMVKARESAA